MAKRAKKAKAKASKTAGAPKPIVASEEHVKAPSREAIAKAIGARLEAVPPASELQMVQAPVFSASTSNVQATPLEAIITFSRAHPMIGAGKQNMAMNVAVAIVNMSLQTLKDLSILTATVVAAIEKEHGEIVTPLTRERSITHKPRQKRVH